MAKSLVIVESPAKAKTINRYLGKDFVVKSSIGHIRDLPMGGSEKDPKDRARKAAATKKLSAGELIKQRRINARAQLVHRMGIDPDHGWTARYEILPGKEKVVDPTDTRMAMMSAAMMRLVLFTGLARDGGRDGRLRQRP